MVTRWRKTFRRHFYNFLKQSKTKKVSEELNSTLGRQFKTFGKQISSNTRSQKLNFLLANDKFSKFEINYKNILQIISYFRICKHIFIINSYYLQLTILKFKYVFTTTTVKKLGKSNKELKKTYFVRNDLA
jgi:hypothetical protein